MYKRILITVIVCLGMLGLPLGGVQPIQNVSAEEQGPPTLSSEGFLPPQAVYEPTIFGAPATDDYLPGLVPQPGRNRATSQNCLLLRETWKRTALSAVVFRLAIRSSGITARL